MSGTEIGPNDIIIHLVNPFKCTDCGTEFFHKSSFLQHLSEHMDKLKAQNPCYQIMCGVSLAAQQPNSVTVTKDILQINENQIFELQDSSIDYTQLPPLKILEQAGILRLPTPEKANQVSLLKFQNNAPVNIAVPPSQSLLRPRLPQRGSALIQEQSNTNQNGSLGFLGPNSEDKQLPETAIDLNPMNDLQNPSTTSDELQAFVQQALLENEGIKVELSEAQTCSFSVSDNGQVIRKNGNSSPFPVIPTIDVTKGQETWATQQHQHPVHEQQHHYELQGVKHVMVFKEMPEPLPQVNDRQRVECKICLNRFASKNVLMRHQVVHSGEKPHSCLKCFKQFNDISSLSKHIKIHKRSHQCPVCLKMFLRRRQMELHLGQHKKKRFIQFGHKYHEVQVATSRNESGQIVHEFSLSVLLKKRSNEGELPKNQQQSETSVENLGHVESVSTPINATSSVESISMDESISLTQQSVIKSAESNLPLSDNYGDVGCMTRTGDKQIEKSGTCKVVYRCGHCKKYINTRPTLSRHLMLHTNERPFRCEQCSKQFRHKSDLVHHYKTHSKPAKCSTCGSAFSKELYLQNHLRKGCPFLEEDNDKFVVLPDLRYQCNLCSKVLKFKANVVRHLRIHEFSSAELDSKKVSKNISKKTGQQKEGSDNGIDMQSDNPDDYIKSLKPVGFRCLICGEEFRFRSYIIIHVRMHLGLRPFKCKECGKGFYGRHMLRKHQHNHTRPFKCPKCGKGFNRRYLMAHHFSKYHNEQAEERMKDVTFLHEEKMLQCNICGKTMKSYQKSLMECHIRLHKDVRPHQCKVCDKTFISAIALKKHSMNHSKPYVCQVCNKGYSRRYLMLDHFERNCKNKIKRHDVSKDMTGSKSDTPQENQILILKGENNESVKDSRLMSYQAEFVTEIDGEKGTEIFKCVPCNKTFTVKEALSRHMRTFMKSTPCKYCKTVFEDKHLTLAHQRSCLGSDVTSKMSAVAKADTATQVISEKQEKVLKTMKEMNSFIDNITAEPVVTSETISFQQEQDQSDQDFEEVLSVLNSENISTDAGSSISADTTASSVTVMTNNLEYTSKEAKDSLSYQCPNCPKSFSTPRGLKIHAASHVRLYKCETCGQDFTQVAKFRCHLKFHEHNVEEKEGSGDEELESQELDDDDAKMNETNEPGKGTSECSPDKRAQVGVDSGDATSLELKRGEKMTVIAKPNARTPFKQRNKKSVDNEDVTLLLMKSGTRGRPFSCSMCRKRFTEESVLHQHLSQIHGVKS